MSTLDEVFNPADTAEQPAAESTPVEQAQAPESDDQPAAPSAAPQQAPEDPPEVKGLRAALMAERAKRQQYEEAVRQWQEQQQRAAAQAQQSEQPHRPAGPRREDFADDVSYWEAVIEHKAAEVADRKLQAVEQQRQQEAQRQQALTEMQAMQQAADNVVLRGQAKYSDFDAAINAGLAPFLNPSMHQALVTADDGEDVAYHLARNPAEAARIAGLKPMQMAVEIGKLSARLQKPVAPAIPQTLTASRNERGQFSPAWGGPPPLEDIFNRKR